MLPLPEAVLWDMDGTLIDQTAPILRCFREVITGFGLPEPDAETIRRSLGGPMLSTMARFVEARHLDEACRRFRSRFPEIMFDGLIVLPGASELIRDFDERGIPQAIFTNKHGDTARAVSRHCGFDDRISVCIGNTDTEWSKPDPQLTRHVLTQIDAADRAAILIGDSPTDAATARNAGIPCYAVATGAHTVDELRDAGATAFESLPELREAFGFTTE
ncbi:MAG: HAD family hydrolase [Opitutales bacterium]